MTELDRATTKFGRLAGFFVCLLLLPAVAQAQASIAGVVRDASGAVLPGVTVEAASPALIERVRVVVTDGRGQYRVENLRPGLYAVTFTLPGFAIVRREGIELTGNFTAAVNVALRVGGLEETITVTGEAPVVDVQNVTRQNVLDHDVIDAIPTGRSLAGLTMLVPGAGGLEAGGGNFRTDTMTTSIHGGQQTDQRTMQNGVPISVAFGGGSPFGQLSNVGAYEEVTLDTAAASAEIATGGLRINLIPRDGGNAFSGTVFSSFINESMQGDNITQELKDKGLATPDAIKRIVDFNPAFGGPIARDRVWFYTTARVKLTDVYPAGAFFNKNANNPNLWTFEPDTARGRPAKEVTGLDGQLRFTWQATPKHKLGGQWNEADNCLCPNDTSATITPDGSVKRDFSKMRNLFADWTAPMTNRVLLEASLVNRFEYVTRSQTEESNPAMISVVEQSLDNLRYRSTAPAQRATTYGTLFYRFSASYITGSHAFKVGVNGGHMSDATENFAVTAPWEYRFNNGVPNQITLFATPYNLTWNGDEVGVYAQDKWTLDRLTLSYGVRYDHYRNSFKDQALLPGVLVPDRNVVFPDSTGVRWHDLTPKSGLAYDVFGNGRTAIKVSLNKYLQGMGNGNGGAATTPAEVRLFGFQQAPVSRIINNTTRSWNDANGDFTPDCDLVIQAANGECGAMASSSFGTLRPGKEWDTDTLTGWGKRGYHWEFTAGVQRELVPRVSMDVSYFRRWYGNFVVEDNRAVSPADFDAFSITAPSDPRLPGGGGYQVSGLYDLKPQAFGRRADTYITFADKFGKQISHWNGVDVLLNARPGSEILLQGGVSTGRTSTDDCEVVEALDNPSPLHCHVDTKFLTQIKFLGAYTIPRIDVQLSAGLQNVPGPEILANYNAPNSAVQPSLGRPLAGGSRNTPVALMEPGQTYGDRATELDMRIAKILRYGRTRTNVMLEFYNIFNSSTVLTQSNTFGAAWQRPQSALPARFVKFGVQFDF